MLTRIRNDVRTALENDPAADHWATVLLTYAGLHAVWGHAIAHRLWTSGHHLTARVFSHVVRSVTGVEIHPAATVGERVFIDHGMGTVVGETAEIGDDVQLFHGVTLGGKSDDPVKRHPTLEDGVTVGASATLIGDITIGEDATVGAGAVVVDDVEPGTTVVGVPAEQIDGDEEVSTESVSEDLLAEYGTDPADADGGTDGCCEAD